MAFQAPTVGQERQNRKILEQLEEQKKRLRMQTQPAATPAAAATAPAAAAAPAAAPASSAGSGTVNPVSQPAPAQQTMLSEPQHMNPAQRAALQHAHANSPGYFITQDSSFGNLILPVLPRFDKT